ncbi:MAG: hypothetical protein WCJ09_28450 [Planctomycetota bacterium]
MFSFAYTTDPNSLVVVEARKSDDRFRWMFGMARMNVGEVKVSNHDREVFHAKRPSVFASSELNRSRICSGKP